MDKRGLSDVITTIILILLIMVAMGIISIIIFSFAKNSSEKSNLKISLLNENFKIKKVLIDSEDPLKVHITFCCATGSYQTIKQIEEDGPELDIGLVIDRSGSMRQSGWTIDLDSNLVASNNFYNVVTPRNAYSSSQIFQVNSGDERIAILLTWDKKEGYNGSEGSEFSLNLKRPSGEWIFGSSTPNTGGKVDPPDAVGNSNEYFNGISSKPQIVYIENPQVGNWEVKVWGWNLRPITNPPSSQNVNISIFKGNSEQISKNPTILSIDAAKNSSKNFVNSKEEDEQISYVVFGSYGELKQTLTLNTTSLLNAVDNTGMEGGTAIQTGIETSKNDLLNNGRENSKKIMIILTDGQNDAGPNIVIQKAQEAKDEDIIIFTIGLTGFVDENMLKQVATKPEYYNYVPDASNLNFIFEEIRNDITNIFETNEKLSDYFLVVFYNNTDSYEYVLNDNSLKPLETKEYFFDLNGKLINISRIEIYPVILTKNGKEVIGQLIQTFEIE